MRSLATAHPETNRIRGGDIPALVEALRELEERRGCGVAAAPAANVPTGWPGVELCRAAVHEWVAGEADLGQAEREIGSGPPTPVLRHRSLRAAIGGTGRWWPPLSVMMHLAGRAARSHAGLVVWIGEMCRVYPPALRRVGARLLERSVFVLARTRDERVWAIDVALRSCAVSAVVADASETGMSESRRFQLGAAAGGGLGLLVRPAWEAKELSAAKTRWRVSPVVSEDDEPRWAVELLRCKGVRPGSICEEARRWVVRQDYETGDLRVVADAVGRCAAPDRAATVLTA